MKILKFLTSRLGAVSLSAGKTAGLAVTVGLIGMNIYNFATDTSAAEEAKVRSLSSIMSSGGALPSEYSGINFDTGNMQFATSEEIAAREGTLFDGGEAAVNALNNISVSSYALGAGDAGLGMGANAAVQVGPDGKAVTGNVSADGSAVGAAAAQQAQKTQINKLGEEKAGGLQRASIAKASGSNMGSSSSGSFGAPARSSQGGSASVKARGAGTSEGYALSGAMPKGSTLLASNSNVRGAASSSSSFIAGNTRTRIGQGSNSREGRSLRDIALASAKVAANKNRAANEGASPFMAKEKLSGGIQIMDDERVEIGGGNSTDEFVDTLDNQENALNQGVNEIDTTEQDRKAHRNRLTKTLVSLFFATIAGMIAISTLKNAGPWGKAASFVVAAALLVALGLFIADAVKYGQKFGWDAVAWIYTILGGVFAVGVGLALFVNSVSNWISKTTGQVLSKLGLKSFDLVSIGMGTAFAAVQTSIDNAVETGKALASDSNKDE